VTTGVGATQPDGRRAAIVGQGIQPIAETRSGLRVSGGAAPGISRGRSQVSRGVEGALADVHDNSQLSGMMQERRPSTP
jgi:hypothetical protein